ncbi:hypothetical protein [Janthinobacterium lividum]|uniref:hypothetical protein n=1 Tax=Janthinobacterium lividum TaxID=29581 RepID=UPI0011142F6A|nr:hypothetical protein [Janthinobacterium lividum]
MKIKLISKILFLAIIASFNVKSYAEEKKSENEKKFDRCVHLAAVFSSAAMYRDGGFSPQEAWKMGLYKDEGWGPITAEERKKITNQVYFDKIFSPIPWGMMRDAIFEICMKPPKNYEPLK